MKLDCSDEALTQNLQDAGCDSKMIEQFLNGLHQGKSTETARLLRQHRSTLLDTIHREQKKIDCLDYLIYRMKQATSR